MTVGTTLGDVRYPSTVIGLVEPVNVTGNVELTRYGLTQLPAKFGTVGGDFNCNGNKLTSLEGAPSHIGRQFAFDDNCITSLVGIHKIIKSCKWIYLDSNPIKEGGLGLLLINGLTFIDFVQNNNSPHSSFEIIAKYLGKGKRGMIDCQTELIKAGYKDFAKI